MKKVNARVDSKGLRNEMKLYPHGEVKIVTFSFHVANRDEAAYSQYKLLLNPGVLQAHLDFETKRGMAVGVPFFDFSAELTALGLKPKFLMVEWMNYKDFITRNNSCSV